MLVSLIMFRWFSPVAVCSKHNSVGFKCRLDFVAQVASSKLQAEVDGAFYTLFYPSFVAIATTVEGFF